MANGEVFRVPKKCYRCGREWEGNSFRQPPSGQHVVGICEGCSALEEERMAELLRGNVPGQYRAPDLTRPIRARE